MYAFIPGMTYSFTTYPVGIIGANYDNVVALGTVNAEVARRTADIDALHAQVYPTLPVGTPNDPNAYNYLILKLPSGGTTILGIPWIREDTVVVKDTQTAQALIFGVSGEDLPKITNALVQSGYTNIQLTLVSQ